MSLRRVRWIVSALLSAGLASGCAVLMESPSHIGGRATLDDAATAARPDSSTKQRRLRVGHTIPSEPEVINSSSETSLSSDSDERDGSQGVGVSTGGGGGDPRLVFGLVAGGGTIGGTSYDGFGEFGVSLGAFVPERWRFDVLGTVSPIQFSNQTLAGESFVNEFDLNLDFTARYYLTAAHTFIGVYPIAGMRMGTLFWDFARPVIVVEDGRTQTIKDDRIDHMSFYGGLGASLAQFRHVHVGASLLGGARLYSEESSHGFRNTLFPDVGFTQIRVEAGFR